LNGTIIGIVYSPSPPPPCPSPLFSSLLSPLLPPFPFLPPANQRDLSDGSHLSIGGKKGSFYHDDIWTIRYLPKFKWNHLTERLAMEKAEKRRRLRAEIAQAKRENNLFLQNVEKSKRMKKYEQKKAAEQAKVAFFLITSLPSSFSPTLLNSGGTCP